MKYIWQRSEWPELTFKTEIISSTLTKARRLQGQLLANAASIGLHQQASIYIDEAFTTSAIEGEKIDREALGSSVGRRLGIEFKDHSSRYVDGLVDMLIDATTNFKKELTEKKLHSWQAALFPTGYSGIHQIEVGKFRSSHEPMQVVSGGKIGRQIVLYEAPPAIQLKHEMKRFLFWWQTSQGKVDGLVRAAIAHFWFVSIHPYDDGNGRIARALTDMALAQDEETGSRLYSLSSVIIKERKEYYAILEKTQKSSCDITEWILWFLKLYIKALMNSQGVIDRTLKIAHFWTEHSHILFNERQRKVIKKMLDAGPDGFIGGMTNKKYVSITRTSRESAKRDLADLEQKGIIIRDPAKKGRSVSYYLRE